MWPLTWQLPAQKQQISCWMTHPGETGSAELFSHSIRRGGSGGVRRVRFTQLVSAPRELAAVRHCFDCSSYFLEVFQNCAPVSTNGAANTSTPPACQTLISDSRRGAQSIFPRTETDTALSVSIISAPDPSASCCTLTTSERRVTQRRFPFYFCAAGGGGCVAICL